MKLVVKHYQNILYFIQNREKKHTLQVFTLIYKLTISFSKRYTEN